LSQELAILDYQVSFHRSLGGQPERDPKIALGLLLDGMTLPDVLFDVLQARAVALAKLAHSLAYDLADVRRLGNLERLGLQTARVLVRGLALVEDFQHIAAFHGDLQMLGDLLLVIIVMLSYGVTYSFDARSLFLAADLSNRIQKPGRPRLGRLNLVHRVSVSGANGADGDDDDDEVTASASSSSSCR